MSSTTPKTQTENEVEGAVHLDGPPALLPTTTIATLPVGSFLENIVVRPNGNLLVTCMSDGTLYQVVLPPPGQRQSRVEKVHVWEGREATGIVEHPGHPDVFFVSVGRMDEQGSWGVWEVDFSSSISTSTSTSTFTSSTAVGDEDRGDSGARPPSVSRFVDVPSALWLNGATALQQQLVDGNDGGDDPTLLLLLLADSLQGRIYRVQLDSGRVVGVWLEHALLGKMTRRPPWPGANGLDIFGGELYATNSDRGLLLKMAVEPSSGAYVADSLEVLQENVCGDDFAFDQRGNLYMTTNPNQTVLRFGDRGRGQRERVAGAEDDEELTGATALAFGRREGERGRMYVTTTGGLVTPTKGKDGPGEARVVRVDVGVAGARN